MSRTALFTLSLLLGACAGEKGGSEGEGEAEEVDSDGDGLTDTEEADAGTDPATADTDGDTITDAEELDLGIDPLSTDSDGDGYDDEDEIAEGSDPADAESKIYTGGWPYNPNKGDITDPGWDSEPDEGQTLPHFEMVDQFGEMVDIYDFAQPGKFMILDVSARWCGYCQEMAKWMEGETNYYGQYFGDEEWYTDVADAVDNGDIYWVTVLVENMRGGPPDVSTVESWYGDYPDPLIPVLADEDQAMIDYLGRDLYGYPTLFLVDENMQFTVYSPRDYTEVFYAVAEMYGE